MAQRAVQVIDDGMAITVIVDGVRLFGDVPVAELADATGVGIAVEAGSGAIRDLEAHPLAVDLGDAMAMPAPWHRLGDEVVVADDFAGPPASDLDGRLSMRGGATWRREYGRGRLLTTGDDAVRVDADVDRPNPGSTAYTVAWPDPAFADVAVEVTPPGSGRGESQRGRAGLILWDDDRNFLTISMFLDDSYEGASIAIFSHLDGFEEIYDAVWSMVGSKIDWGIPHELRVSFDGTNLMTLIDDEPVLYRAITDIYPERAPMAINRVGVAVNWEWGDDTGSCFRKFVARRAS